MPRIYSALQRDEHNRKQREIYYKKREDRLIYQKQYRDTNRNHISCIARYRERARTEFKVFLRILRD